MALHPTVAESLLAELNCTEGAEQLRPTKHKRWESPPPSPSFHSPDYYPYSEGGPKECSRSSSPHKDVLLTRLVDDTREELRSTKAELTDTQSLLGDVKAKFGRLRSRVIYLEGELAVYKRFAVIHSQEFKAPIPQFHYPPPPPPRRV